MVRSLPFLFYIEGVEVVYLWYLGGELEACFLQGMLQGAGGVALYVGEDTLLVRGRVGVPCQSLVEPDTAVAVIGIADTAERRMVKLQELLVRYA